MSLREYFRPVQGRTNTDTYLEIGKWRWEGWPATILAAIILCGPLYVVLVVLLAFAALHQ